MRELRGSSLPVGVFSQRVRGPEDMGSRRKGDRAVTKAAVSHAIRQFKATCVPSVLHICPLGPGTTLAGPSGSLESICILFGGEGPTLGMTQEELHGSGCGQVRR